MKNEKTTILLSLILTFLLTYFSYSYVHYKNLNDAVRSHSFLLEQFEEFDFKYGDLKFKMRDQNQSDAKVALIAIDDDSIREVGRWPWDRDVMAKITQNLSTLGASSIGFDVIFSEPDKSSPTADTAMAGAVEKNADKLVLGAFSENQTAEYRAFQDYCVTEAFLANGGDQMIKLNPTVAIDDSEDSYDTLKWNKLFSVIFPNVKNKTEIQYLESMKKKSADELTQYQKNYLASIQAKSLYDYCKTWLTEDDPFKIADFPPLKKIYTDIFSESSDLKALSVEDAVEKFKKDIPYDLIPQNVEWTANIPSFQNAAMYTASFNATQDADGYVRRYPLFYRSGNKLGTSYIPSLSLQTFLSAKKYRAEVKLEKGRVDKKSKSVISFKIFDTQVDPERLVTELPVDPMGRLMVNYYGRQMTLPYVSAKELLSDEPTMKVHYSVKNKESNNLQITEETVNKSEYFKDRSVIIGATAEAVYDLRSTPLEPNYPGPEIHLTMLANLIDNNVIKKIDKETTYLPILVLVLGVILSLVWAHFGAMISFLIFLGLSGIIFSADYYLFSHKNTLSTAVLLLTEVFVLYGWTTIYKYFTEEKKKKELKSTFSKYVSPAVVDEILKQPENLKLGGRKQRMSVFFSDVRGFTTISEKLPPVELAKLLNDYLTPMTELVFQNKGTLDKYMGDAIMAFFGAPIFFDDHASHACRCALVSLETLAELQREFAAKNLPVIDIGIGINTGEMSVGNMGSNIVQSYTVMGDSVNLASRLEGINKEYGTRIIISEFTYNDVKEKFTCREVDWVRVKGKTEPIRIYELIKEGSLPDQDQTWMMSFNEGFQAYHRKEFAQALSHFEKVLNLKPGDPVSELYVERCTEYQSSPPPQDWDGVFTMKTK